MRGRHSLGSNTCFVSPTSRRVAFMLLSFARPSLSLADGELDIDEYMKWSTAQQKDSPPQSPPPSPPQFLDAATAHKVPLKKLPKKLRGGYGMIRRLLANEPAFRSLPEPLMWPNPEVTLGSMFSTGLLSCASAVLGAWIGGYNTRDGSLAIALMTIVLVLSAFAHQAHHLIVFLGVHNQQCWKPSERPQCKEEIDDPIFALLTNLSCGFFRPMPREQGFFECPEEDDEEPARTERAISRFFSLKLGVNRFTHARPGDAMAELTTWLSGASGTKRGVWYFFAMVAQQIAMATLLGILFSFDWTTTPMGTKVVLVCIICFQIFGVLWTAWNTANDRIDGVQNCIVHSLECAATCFVLASAVVADQAKTADGEMDVEKLAESLSLTVLSGYLLVTAVFFPMSITLYNSFLVPLCQRLWSAEGSLMEVVCQMIMTCILLPYQMVTTMLGCKGLGAAADIVSEMEGSIIELATSSSTVTATGDEEDDVEATGPEEEEEGLAALRERRARAPPSKGARKRMKQQLFLARVRKRMAESQGKIHARTA